MLNKGNFTRKLFVFVCFLGLRMNAYSESIFSYDKQDLIIGPLGLGVFTAPFFVENKPGTVPDLNRASVNAFDRGLMFSYNEAVDLVSDLGVYGMLVLPLFSLVGNMQDRDAWLTYGAMYSEALMLTFGTKDLLKNAVVRYRPYVYTSGVPDEKVDDYYNSFPSGSTALAFLSAGFLSATWTAEHPESRWKVPVVVGVYALATGVAACRIVSGSHFLSDVLTGAAIGSLYGWLVPLLHKKRGRQDLAVQVGINSVALSWWTK